MGQHTLEGAIEIFQTLCDDHDLTPTESEAWSVILDRLGHQSTISKLQPEIDTIKRLRGIIADMMSMRYMACENRHKDPGCGYCDACKFTTEVSCRAVAAAVPDPTT